MLFCSKKDLITILSLQLILPFEDELYAKQPKAFKSRTCNGFWLLGHYFYRVAAAQSAPLHEGEGIAYLEALFTAASAVCVTGLVVADTGTFYTPLGQRCSL